MRLPVTLIIAALFLPALAAAQAPGGGPRLSGLFNGNFQLRTDEAARALTGGAPGSRFDVARVYLTVNAPVGERADFRVTTDVYQNAADGYYGGLAIRLKYAILQYQLTSRLLGIDGLRATARAGMIQTVVMNQVEAFWPRWIASTALEMNGFFSSADIGVATLVQLPHGRGETYLVVTNGNGYASAETDRFKDVAARVTLTPFASDSGWWRSFAITPWYHKGWRASQFVLPDPTQVGTVSDGLQRDRMGVFAALRTRALTLGAQYARRIEDIESGANTVVSPRAVAGRTGVLVTGFLLARPLELLRITSQSPLTLVSRFDRFRQSTTGDARNQFLILGAAWDLNDRLSVAVDYQGLTPTGGSATPAARAWSFRWTAPF